MEAEDNMVFVVNTNKDHTRVMDMRVGERVRVRRGQSEGAVEDERDVEGFVRVVGEDLSDIARPKAA